MMKLMLVMSLMFSIVSFAENANEMHFDDSIIQKCRSEVRGIGCGIPTDENESSFIKCVDEKVNGLSALCQDFHNAMSDTINK